MPRIKKRVKTREKSTESVDKYPHPKYRYVHTSNCIFQKSEIFDTYGIEFPFYVKMKDILFNSKIFWFILPIHNRRRQR